jgi:hypothetical protein
LIKIPALSLHGKRPSPGVCCASHINKNIAKIFRSDNLLEFKSPEDYLSVRDFLKVYAYACLYAAITPDVELSGVTLTFVEQRHPRELIGYLTKERHYGVEETGPGIYVVRGDYLPIQIIETKRLPVEENLWLRSLSNDLEGEAASIILEAEKGAAREVPLSAYMDVLLRANPEAFMEAWKMGNRKRTFEEVFTEAGIIPEWIERGKKEAEAEYKPILEEYQAIKREIEAKNRENEELRRKLRQAGING